MAMAMVAVSDTAGWVVVGAAAAAAAAAVATVMVRVVIRVGAGTGATTLTHLRCSTALDRRRRKCR